MTERVWLTREEVDRLVDQAAVKGATEALKKVGLSDEGAADDIREIRTLLDAWNTGKKVAMETIVKVITTAFLAALATGVAISTWRSGS